MTSTPSKSVADSKTIWANTIIGAMSLTVPLVAEFVKENPEVSIILVNLINIVLRRFTKQPITIIRGPK